MINSRFRSSFTFADRDALRQCAAEVADGRPVREIFRTSPRGPFDEAIFDIGDVTVKVEAHRMLWCYGGDCRAMFADAYRAATKKDLEGVL